MQPASRRARIVRAALLGGSFVALASVALSLAVRFTVRDRVAGFAAIYYATPLALAAAAAAGAALASMRVGRPRVAAFAAAVALACGGLYVSTSFVRNDPRPPGALRGVLWNVEHGCHGWTSVAETLAGFAPDVVWLAESDDGDSVGADAALRAAFPGRAFVRARGGLAVIARGEASLVDRRSLSHASRCAVFHVVVDGRAFDAVQGDIASSPLVSRTVVFRRLERVIDERGTAPLLVVGDFNTPRDSVAFDSWRGKLPHAFETTGRGLDATWPVPCPVLSIDHVWAGGGLAIRTCELPWTWRSDHLPVVFTFDVP